MAQTPEEKKAANREYQLRYRETHRELLREKSHKYEAAHPGQGCSRSQKWRREHPEQARATRRKYRYGINTEEQKQLLVDQKGICAICGDATAKLEMDHSHVTGKVRGWLCKKCNVGLGHFNDDSILLRKALEFIDNNKE